jgi:nucleotide-binding universal stress UspA family protein
MNKTADDFKKLLIAIDDGPAAESIAMNGFRLGKKLGAEIAVLSVIDPVILVSESGATASELTEIAKDDYEKSLKILIDKVFGDFKVRLFIEEGDPCDTILRVAEEWKADILVLGTHGRTGLPHLILGSVAEKVIRHSNKPLFIIPQNHG